ncbi:glycoside hydrolase family 16 protein [Noviherbaspirillum aridicola]|nr:glycoside hydrolase family 16 protein [Noviherbaspirillum aridicola]
MQKSVIQQFKLSTLTCVCSAVLLAACGGGGGSGTTEPAASQASVQGTAAVATESAAAETVAGDTSAGASSDKADASGESAATPSANTSGSEQASAPVPYGQDASAYTLSFSEEFNTYNTNLWNDHMWYEGSNPTKNYTVEDGMLKIWPQRDASGNFFNRTIDTDGKYYQTYGYFEIEAKLPVGKGTWPAFWLFNHIDHRRPEMDVMEAYAGGAAPWGFEVDGVAHPQAYAPTVWKGDAEGQLVGTRQYDTGTDLSAGFHKYAVKWEPNKQTYYFDGKEVLTVNVTMTDPMYLMLDLWYGSASGTPDDSTPQGKSNSFEVKYVRAWQFK